MPLTIDDVKKHMGSVPIVDPGVVHIDDEMSRCIRLRSHNGHSADHDVHPQHITYDLSDRNLIAITYSHRQMGCQ